jgi:hypothetical protein
MNSDIIWFAVFVWMLILPMLGYGVFNRDHETYYGGAFGGMMARPTFGEKIVSCGLWWFFFGIVAAFYLMMKYIK